MKKNNLKIFRKSLFIAGLFFLLIPGLSAQDLLIYPKRLVFQGTQDRVQTLNLTNTGEDTASYRISYKQAKMTPEGKIETIEQPDPGQRFADPFLRVFPHSVSIAPGRSQQIKVQLIRISELETGEYRSHLYIRAIPEVKKPQENNNIPEGEYDLSIKITPIYGYGIANIIKIGNPDIQVDITNLVLQKIDGDHFLNVHFNRNGNMSTYGEVNVNFISGDGQKKNVATLKGFAIYSPGILRKEKIKLDQLEGIDYTNGNLEVIYSSSGTGEKTYATGALKL